MLLHTIGLLLQAAFRSSMYHQFSFFNNAHLGPYCPLHVEYIYLNKNSTENVVKRLEKWFSLSKEELSMQRFQFEMKVWNYQNQFYFLNPSKNQEYFWGHQIQSDSKLTFYALFGNMYSKSVFKTLEISWVKRNVIDVPFRPISFMGH